MYCNPGSNHVTSIPETKKKTWFTIHPKITRFLNIEPTILKHLLRLKKKEGITDLTRRGKFNVVAHGPIEVSVLVSLHQELVEPLLE